MISNSTQKEKPLQHRAIVALMCPFCIADTLASQHGGATKPSTETFRKVARLIESTSQFDFLDARR